MPGITGVVQEAGVPARPSISTRQSRQEPKASTMSVAHSFGICVPDTIAARMIDVPSGTVTRWPSMVSVTSFSDFEAGVPKSVSSTSDICVSSLFRSLQMLRLEILGEVVECAHHGVGRETAQSTERAKLHGVAEVLDQREVIVDAFAAQDLVDGLRPAGRSDPARRAFAAGFDGAELEGKTRLLRHVDAVVEHHDAAMADQPVACGKGLIVERRVEQRAREIGAERTADLRRAHRAAGKRAAADIVDELAERNAEGSLEQAAMADVAGELDRHGAARAPYAEIGIGLATIGKNEGHRGERQHVIDDGGLAEQTLVRRQWRLGADDAAAAFQALQERGFLTADIGAGADAHLDVEGVARTGDARAEITAAPRRCDRRIHR